MPGSMPDVLEIAAAIGAGIVFGGTIIRFLVTRWLKDREEFERATVTRFEALSVEVRTAKEYADRGDRAVREEGIAAREAMTKGAEHEFKVLRDRWHALDTLTQVLVNNIGLMREEIKGVIKAQDENTQALHDIEKTLARIASK